MDRISQFLQTSAPTVATICVFLATLFLLILFWRTKGKTCKEAPEVPGGWPIIGHLHLLGGLLHEKLSAMADKYGPIFTIRLGVHRALVVSSWQIAKECYIANDRVFASRPDTVAAETMGYNYVMIGFAPYGPYWTQLRKILMYELLSSRRLESLKPVQESEINTSIGELYTISKNGPASAEIKKWFGDVTLNIILRIVVGKRYSNADEIESKRCQKALGDFMKLIGMFVVEDAIPAPFLKWFDFNGYKKEMKHTANELDSLFQGYLDEHKQKRKSDGDQDFMDVMMSILEGAKISNYDNDIVIKSTCMAIIAGGNDTTMITLTWILSLLVNHKQVLKKVQDELDSVVGRDRIPIDSDIKKLVYLQAVIKETLRLYPAAPVADQRIAAEDCNVAGYHVPAGTRLLVHLRKIHRDPVVWSHPNEFLPERFLTDYADMDVKGQTFELIPFGTGRRACPGTSFALQVMASIMARLLHAFDMTTPMDTPVDMTESPGLFSIKATALDVVITPRLRPELYKL